VFVSSGNLNEIGSHINKLSTLSLFVNSRDGVVFHDADGKIIAANPAACEILGVTMDEILGQTPMSLNLKAIHIDGSAFPGKDHPAMLALETGKSVENVTMGVHHPKTGNYRWIAVNAVPEFKSDEPKSFQVFSTFRDITAEFVLNKQVAESQAQFIAFLNTLDEGVWYRDFHTRELVFVNDAAARIFGIEKGEFFEDNSNRYEDFIHPSDRLKVITAQTEHFTTGKEVNIVWRLITSNNDLRHVRVRLFTFSLPGTGNKVFSAGLMSDITDEYLIQTNNDLQREKAEELNRLKSNLLSTISHEFRTPITGIIGFSKLLQEDVSDSERISFAQNIEKSTNRLYKTLESILDFSILDSKKVDLRPSVLSVKDSIKMTLDRTLLNAQDKGLYFQQSYIGPDKIYFYRNILDTILKYLLDNAIKFTSEGGIRFILEINSNTLIVQIHDTGSGIPSETIPHVFEPFRQGSEGVARLYEGVGLGLAIVKRYLDSINGEISLKTNEHGGSSFIVSIPLPQRQEHLNINFESPNGAEGFRILYVEDNPIMHLLVSSMLKNTAIDYVKNMAQTLEAVKKSRYDILLLDVNLGEKENGIKLLHEIRGMEGYSDVPVVMITAYSLTELEDMRANFHQVEYLSKPFSEKQLKSAIKQFLPQFD
jgi:PAS domain S-box-containing protein